MCMQGQKLVIFATGLCNSNCYYCPVPFRLRKNITLINGIKLNGCDDRVVSEAIEMAAKGASFTGGEPFIVIDKIIEFTAMLKNSLGKSFHIHSYTNGKAIQERKLREWVVAGLDELRIHPTTDLEVLATIKKMNLGIPIGVETPVIPTEKEKLISMITYANKVGIDFINLVELTFSKSNEAILLKKGFKPGREYHSREGVALSVEGSLDLAVELLNFATKSTPCLSVHVCSVENRMDQINKRYDIKYY